MQSSCNRSIVKADTIGTWSSARDASRQQLVAILLRSRHDAPEGNEYDQSNENDPETYIREHILLRSANTTLQGQPSIESGLRSQLHIMR